MPRPPRADAAGEIYPALNRGNGRMTIFHKDADYEAFERVLNEGLERYPVSLFAYQWMPNHWHMVLSPREDGTLSGLMYWVTMTHTTRHHAHYQSTGSGHLYQGRFKSFPIQSDEHIYVVCRYVERNALAAGLVSRAEHWRFGSLYNWLGGSCGVQLASGHCQGCPSGKSESTDRSVKRSMQCFAGQYIEVSHSETLNGWS
jgi:putative transposase